MSETRRSEQPDTNRGLISSRGDISQLISNSFSISNNPDISAAISRIDVTPPEVIENPIHQIISIYQVHISLQIFIFILMGHFIWEFSIFYIFLFLWFIDLISIVKNIFIVCKTKNDITSKTLITIIEASVFATFKVIYYVDLLNHRFPVFYATFMLIGLLMMEIILLYYQRQNNNSSPFADWVGVF